MSGAGGYSKTVADGEVVHVVRQQLAERRARESSAGRRSGVGLEQLA